MPVGLLLVRLAAMAVGLAATFGVAHADTFEITPRVEEQWRQYLAKVGDAKDAAFVVSFDGYNAYHVVCEPDMVCGAARMASENCRAATGLACKVLADGRQPRFRFQTVKLSEYLPQDSPIRARVLDDAALRAKVVGNTLSGTYINKLKWAEYLAPNGAIIGRDDMQGPYTGSYVIKDRKICFYYTFNDLDNCLSISLDGDQIQAINEAGDLSLALRDIVLLPGNAVRPD